MGLTARTDSPRGSYFCPAEDGVTYTPPVASEYKFKLLCDTDWPVGVKGAIRGSVVDIQAVVAYSVRDCIDQCAVQRSSGGKCSAVAYGADVERALRRTGIRGNCFLKDQRGKEDLADHSGQAEAAYLIAEDEN